MKHYNNSRPRVVGLVTLCGLLVGLIVAHERGPRIANADDKIFAPQVCAPTPAFDPDDPRALLGVREVVQFTNGDYRTFFCPLMRDEVTGTLDDVWVRVNNTDDEPTQPPRCCVYSVSLGGGSFDVECRDAPNDLGPMSLHLGLDDFTEFDYGQYIVSCELGFGDGIISIRTSESG